MFEFWYLAVNVHGMEKDRMEVDHEVFCLVTVHWKERFGIIQNIGITTGRIGLCYIYNFCMEDLIFGICGK